MTIDTFADVTVTQPPTEDELVRNNRYLIDGKRYTRASTFAKTIDDDYRLNQWRQRMVAVGVAERRELLLAVSAAKDDKSKLDALCDQAITAASGNAGRDIGTSLHGLVEDINRGQDVTVAEPWNSDLAAYRAATAAAGVTVERDLIERVVVCEPLGVAGRFDLAVRLPGYEKPLVADLKTGGYLAWLSFAVQLAVYARAEKMYDRTTGLLVDKPEFEPDAGLVIHLPEGTGTCTLYVVDLAAGWEAAQLCKVVRKWRSRKDLGAVYNPAATLDAQFAFLRARVERLRDAHPDALNMVAALWPAGVAPLRAEDRDTHDAWSLSHVEKVLVELEARFGLPFLGSGDPDGGLVAIDAERMVARLKALPADLLEDVTARAKAAGVPHLKSLDVRREHLDALEQVVGPAEQAHATRMAEVRGCVGFEFVDVEDEAMVQSALVYATNAYAPTDDLDFTDDQALRLLQRIAGTLTLDRLTDDEAARFVGLCAALAAGDLRWVATDDGWTLGDRVREALMSVADWDDVLDRLLDGQT